MRIFIPRRRLRLPPTVRLAGLAWCAVILAVCCCNTLGAQQAGKSPTPLQELEKQAAAGEAEAMFALGERLRRGEGTTIDLRKAAEWYGKAAQKGHPAAMTQIGRMYRNGQGTGKSELQSLNCFRRAAEFGHPAAMNLLGLMYVGGEGTQADPARAAELFQQAADKGDASAMLNLAGALAEGRGLKPNETQAKIWYAKAETTFKKAADAGDADAMVGLVTIFRYGQGMEPQPDQAAAWCRKAAEIGRTDAMLFLGMMYVDGEGVAENVEQGRTWWLKAAERDDPEAMYLLAAAHRTGTPFAKDAKQSLAWCQKAAAAGHAEAMRMLGELYATGEGVPKDDKKAQECYSQAGQLGDGPALTQLGHFYAAGRAVAKDEQAAANFYRAGADAGDVSGAYELARCYAEGRGLVKDEAQAARWYRQAAFDGHVAAGYELGQLHAAGFGREQQPKIAGFWYRVAANQGHVPAMRALSDALGNGTGVQQGDRKADAKRTPAKGEPRIALREPTSAQHTRPPEATEPGNDAPASHSAVTSRSVIVVKALSENDLALLVELRIPDSAVCSRIQTAGVATDVEEAAIGRLQQAGASGAVLTAVRQAVAAKKKPATTPALTYQDVLHLLSLSVDEQVIIRRHASSPTKLSLNDEQFQELQRAGASQKLLADLLLSAHGATEDAPPMPMATKPEPNAGTTSKSWGEFIDPVGDCKFGLEQHSLTITVPGLEHDLWPGKGNVNAPLALQETAGDFTVEVSVVGLTKAEAGTAISGLASAAAFHAGTVVIWQDGRNFVRLDRTDMHSKGRAVTSCYLHVFQDGERSGEVAAVVRDTPTQLRLRRHGGYITASYSEDGAKTWRSFPTQRVELRDKVRVGVAALNNTSRPSSATFEGLKLTQNKMELPR